MTTIPTRKKKRFYHTWWFWISLIVVLAIGGSVAAKLTSKNNPDFSAYSYLQESVTAEKHTFDKRIAANGVIVNDQLVDITAEQGTVDDISVNVGDVVSKNAILMKISGRTIKAPFDGRVVSIDTFEGAPVSFGTPLMEFGFQSTHIEFIASEQEALELKAGQSVFIQFPSYNSGRDSYVGEVNFVDMKKRSATTTTQTIDTGYVVRITMKDVPQEVATRLGLTADVDVEIGKRESVLSIDTGAIQYADDNSAFVYRVPELNADFVEQANATDDITTLLETQTVEVGFVGDQYAEILSGLNEGEQVLLYVPSGGNTTFPF